jgi:hypothetical protein
MRVSVLLKITGDDGVATPAEEIAAFDKATERLEDLGLSIAEGKTVLAAVQSRTVKAQAAAWSERNRSCAACDRKRHGKGSYPVVFHTLYGDVELDSPRLYCCPCQKADGPATVSPLRDLIGNRVAPERLYLEARWASLVPYASAAGLLSDLLPLSAGMNATTLRQHVLHVAERTEGHLGDERACFIDGCPAEWQKLPIPEGRIVVGLDGGYVRNWDDRKTNFELIVGRSIPEDRAPRYIGLTHGYDSKPKRRLFDVLKSQGLQANQEVTFLTDGGEEVRALTEFCRATIKVRQCGAFQHSVRIELPLQFVVVHEGRCSRSARLGLFGFPFGLGLRVYRSPFRIGGHLMLSNLLIRRRGCPAGRRATTRARRPHEAGRNVLGDPHQQLLAAISAFGRCLRDPVLATSAPPALMLRGQPHRWGKGIR